MTTSVPPTKWALPDPRDGGEGVELLAIGADLEPSTLIAAYRAGLFPMPEGRRIGWWSPDPRGAFLAGDLHISRSLARSMRRYAITVDVAFDEVVGHCADRRRPGGWITKSIRAAYGQLHRLGWAHSFEVRDESDKLVGGLYGVQIGGLFAGESMFHLERDASKVAVAAAIRALDLEGVGRPGVFDVQWATSHLRTLGAREMARRDYCDLIAEVVELPAPPLVTTKTPCPDEMT